MKYQLAFISGATSGLGKELAFLLAEKNIPLFITARNKEALLSLQAELEKKTSVFIFPADLSYSLDVVNLIEELKKQTPDLIINNAGFGLYGDILSFSLENQMHILKVNIEALTRISIESARALKTSKKQGTIMNISSTAGNYIYPSFALYAASKRFVSEFSLSFDKEMSSYGIRVLTSLPGRFNSSFKERALGGSSTPSYWDSIPLNKTAWLILKQIQKNKPYEIIDFRYKILNILSSFFPKSWIALFLRKGIQKLIKKT